MKNIKNIINWKLYLVLFSVTFVSIIAILPYASLSTFTDNVNSNIHSYFYKISAWNYA